MPRNPSLPFRKNLLAIAMGAALTPTWALELVQEPPLPTSKSAFVAPNVIISVDDSGSMNFGVKTDYTVPDTVGRQEEVGHGRCCPPSRPRRARESMLPGRLLQTGWLDGRGVAGDSTAAA